MTLYLKYRPQTISELDIKQVREALEKLALTKDRPHAFLFSGPKGTGKTSAARILAKVVNCTNLRKNGEPCNKCDQCLAINNGNSLDVLEMDAASNRGIDDIRSLRESVILSPNKAVKKIYIIDEAHMLTAEAANAFLKTLEEPPSHVVFILATTDPQKLPSTVRSRLTNVVFSKASESEIKRQLRRVSKGEKLNVEDGVFELIAKKSGGSFRDAVKILEGLVDGRKKITLEKARQALEMGGNYFEELAGALRSCDIDASLEIVERYVREGGVVVDLIDELIEFYHRGLLEGKDALDDRQNAMRNLEILIEAREKIFLSPLAEVPLEIAIVKMVVGSKKEDSGGEEIIIGGGDEEGERVKIVAGGKSMIGQACVTKEAWAKVMEQIREKNFSVDALLRTAHPIDFDGENLNLGVYYQFHKEKLEDQKNRRLLEDTLFEIFGFPIRVICSVEEKPKIEKKAKQDSVILTETGDGDIIEAAKEIFGG